MRRISRCLVFIVLVGMCQNSLAVQTEPLKLKKIQQKISHLQSEVKQERVQEQHLQKALREVEIDLGHLNKSFLKTKVEVSASRLKLASLRTRAKDQQSKLEEQRQLLVKQCVEAYRMGQYEYVKLFLNQENPAYLDRMLSYFGYFNQARLQLVGEIKKILAQLAETRQDIVNRTHELQVLQLQLARQKQRLLALKTQREQVLQHLKRQIKDHEAELVQFAADKRALQKMLQQLPAQVLRQKFYRLRGHLPWPVTGQLISQFGQTIAHSHLKHNGVFIRAEAGQAVQAVSKGKVVFADWLSGFGLLLIVEHAKGYMSLYGHNQSLYKRVGEWVDSGEMLATVGNSGGYRQSGLYFELRHKGVPLDPTKWCRKTGVSHHVSFASNLH